MIQVGKMRAQDNAALSVLFLSCEWLKLADSSGLMWIFWCQLELRRRVREAKERVLMKQHDLYALRLVISTAVKGLPLYVAQPVTRSLRSWPGVGILFCRVEKKSIDFSKMISFIHKHQGT